MHYRFFKKYQLFLRLNNTSYTLVLLLLCFFFPLKSYSQKKLEIIHAGSLKFDETLGNGAKRLIGDVQFKHDDVLMFCDSAYFYNDNTLEAFSRVHIQQSDTIHLYGDYLKYNGNDKKAVITGNVKMDKGEMHLQTNAIDYDLSTGIGNYNNFGKIVNKENELVSQQGYLHSKTNDLFFKKNVVVTRKLKNAKDPEFTINCDTMQYNTSSKITYFFGPTTIKSDKNLIYCEDGWYHTENEQARFSKNSYILTENQKMIGDSVFYDGEQNIAKALKNVEIIDTAQRMIIKGDYAIHYETSDLSVVTDKALFIKMFKSDTLYLHADTLKALGVSGENNKMNGKSNKTADKQASKNIAAEGKNASTTKPSEGEKPKMFNRKSKEKNKKAKVEGNDKQVSSKKGDEQNNKQLVDTAHAKPKFIYAYHRVKFYMKDIQGKCDSMISSLNDSVMKLYGNPTFWSDENQLTADSVKVYSAGDSIKSVELEGNSFLVAQQDSIHFNQIRGKKMTGYLRGDSLYLIKVNGNGQTIYYLEEDKEVNAVNRADCSNMDIYLKSNKISRIVFLTKPDATLFPIEDVNEKEMKLKGFLWRDALRPKTWQDVFVYEK